MTEWIRRQLRALGAAAVCWLAAAGAAHAADPQDTLNAAEQAASRGNYQEALDRYLELAESAPADPALLYNLGTAYARTGQRGLAIWCYLRALRLTPRDADIRSNLKALAPDWPAKVAPTPIPPVNWLFYRMTANEWGALAAGASLLAMLLAAVFFWISPGRRARPALRRTALICLVAAAGAYPFAILHYHLREGMTQAVVVTDDATVRSGPNETQIETFTLHAGDVVRVESGTTPGWLKIAFGGGRVGFVARDAIRFLTP